METIFGFIPFVKEQAAFHERKAAEFQGTKRERLHKMTAEKLRGLEAAIDSLNTAKILRPPDGFNPLAIAPSDLKGLPPELLKQLNIPESDKLDTEIVDIINQAGGTLLIDRILIELYKRTGEIHVRNQLVSRFYRMNKKGLVYSSPARKGAYTTIKPDDEQGDIGDETQQLDLDGGQ